MALVNHETKDIHCKILYVGPNLSGKTTTMRALYKELTEKTPSQDLFFEDKEEQDKYFEFLPLSLGDVNSYQIKLHLYSRPYWGVYDTLEGLLFQNLDGLVYVFDSDPLALDDNINELSDVRERLDDKGLDAANFPQVFQYNKRDLLRKLPIGLLNIELNTYRYPSFETVAIKSVGVKESLTSLAKQILSQIKAE